MIEFVNEEPKIPEDDGYIWYVVVSEGKQVGRMKKSKHGPGYFLSVDGMKWRNVGPRPRYHQEADRAREAEFTYVKTLAAAKVAVKTALEKLRG